MRNRRCTEGAVVDLEDPELELVFCRGRSKRAFQPSEVQLPHICCTFVALLLHSTRKNSAPCEAGAAQRKRA